MVRSQLNFAEVVALGGIVKTRYTASGLDFIAFTASINATPEERAKFRKDVTVSPVKSMVESLGIKSNRARGPVGQEEFSVFLADRVAKLEDQVNRLAHTVAQQQQVITRLMPLLD